MELPDFELGPLEMLEIADDEPAIVPASACVRVARGNFLLRLCRNRSHWHEPMFFFRLDIPDAPVVTNRSRSSAECLALSLQLQEAKNSSFDLSPWFRQYLEEGNFERKLSFRSLDSHKPLGLSFGAKVHHWKPTIKSGGGISFQMSYPRLQDFSHIVIHESNAVIVDEVERTLADQKSDCYFSWRWTQMNSDEQQKLTSQFIKGDYEEFCQVMKWMTYENADIGLQSVVEWMVALTADWIQTPSEPLSQSNKYQLIDRGGSINREKIKIWLDVVESYFSPCYDASLERYSVVKHCSLVSHFEIYISVPIPTHHERLEARLRLREWLIGKVPPDEIPALLGEA
jgi:hypothetical protein